MKFFSQSQMEKWPRIMQPTHSAYKVLHIHTKLILSKQNIHFGATLTTHIMNSKVFIQYFLTLAMDEYNDVIKEKKSFWK